MLDFYESSALQLAMWFAGAAVLGLAIAYGVMKAGNIKGRARAKLDRNTRASQAADDPQKRTR